MSRKYKVKNSGKFWPKRGLSMSNLNQLGRYDFKFEDLYISLSFQISNIPRI